MRLTLLLGDPGDMDGPTRMGALGMEVPVVAGEKVAGHTWEQPVPVMWLNLLGDSGEALGPAVMGGERWWVMSGPVVAGGPVAGTKERGRGARVRVSL